MDVNVDIYIAEAKRWQAELEQLRMIALGFELQEALKWRTPCYSHNDSNVLIINTLKDYCALGFFKGALLKDEEGLLVKPGENTQAVRMFKFTSVAQIIEQEHFIRAYIAEAIELEKAGLKVAFNKDTTQNIPDELQEALDKNTAFSQAYHALTPGRQRAYCLYFSAPKQSTTRHSRIEKYIPRILDGKGINDCTCGFSQKMPYCDGSHKYAV